MKISFFRFACCCFLFLLHNFSFANSLEESSLGGHACNISHTPTATNKWSISLYDLASADESGKVVFSTNKNRKIQSVACTPDGKQLIFSFRETTQGDYEVYGLNLLTNELNKLTDNETDDFDVSISENGLVMAWQMRLADDRQAITLRTYNERGSAGVIQ